MNKFFQKLYEASRIKESLEDYSDEELAAEVSRRHRARYIQNTTCPQCGGRKSEGRDVCSKCRPSKPTSRRRGQEVPSRSTVYSSGCGSRSSSYSRGC